MNQETKVAVVGGSGYAGLELVRLLQRHPSANLRVCFSTNPSLSFSDYLPNRGARGITVASLAELSQWVHELDTVFLATPIEVSVELAPLLLKEGINVIDLSGAFRLTNGTTEDRLKAYESFYQFAHPCPELLDQARGRGAGDRPAHLALRRKGQGQRRAELGGCAGRFVHRRPAPPAAAGESLPSAEGRHAGRHAGADHTVGKRPRAGDGRAVNASRRRMSALRPSAHRRADRA